MPASLQDYVDLPAESTDGCALSGRELNDELQSQQPALHHHHLHHHHHHQQQQQLVALSKQLDRSLNSECFLIHSVLMSKQLK